MIFLLIYVLVYGAVVLTRARLTELNGAPQPAHVNRNGLLAFVAAMPLGFLSPGIWLLVLVGLLGYQATQAARQLRRRHRAVQYNRGKRVAP